MTEHIDYFAIQSFTEFVNDYVAELQDYELMAVWNDTYRRANYLDDLVYDNDAAFLDSLSKESLIEQLSRKDYSPHHAFVRADTYHGGFFSSDDIYRLIDKDELAERLHRDSDEVADDYNEEIVDLLTLHNIETVAASIDRWLWLEKPSEWDAQTVFDVANKWLDVILENSTVDQIKAAIEINNRGHLPFLDEGILEERLQASLDDKAAIDLNEKMNFEIDDDLLHKELEIKEYRETHQTTISELTPTPDVPATKTEDLSL